MPSKDNTHSKREGKRPGLGRKGSKASPKGRPPKWELEAQGKKKRFWADKPKPEVMQWLATQMGATGMTARELCRTYKPAPTYEVLMGWVARDPEIEKLYLTAQRAAVHTRIEDLVERAHGLLETAEQGALQKDQVAAFKMFASVIQWVAAKWNREVYGEQRDAKVMVPVQFITNLDFGQPGVEPAHGDDIYTLDMEAVNKEKSDGDTQD